MRVEVDFDTCESHAQCMAIAPAVFEVRDDGCLYLLEETPDDSLRSKVLEAAQACPTGSIFVLDE